MLCQFERLIYPQNVSSIDAGSFMIAVYRPCENIRDSAGNMVTQVKAVGYCLPIADNLRYELQGHWSKNPKHGVQFEVENYDEVITPTKEGIIAYLSSGQIKGIGPKMAEKIYDAFGLTALDVLDKEPERLLAISGISAAKLKKICDSYLANRGARDVVAFLTPHGITPNRAVKLYKEYGDRAMDIVKNHPYQLCEIAGIGFKTADRIAMSMGFDQLSVERVDEGILYALTDVAMLSPYRQKTETGVNALNEMLRELVNPPDEGKPEVVCGKRKFRVGDKVMQVKNFEDVSNGDIGYIRNIFKYGDESTVCVDFGDGRNMEYDSSELDMLDLGYASTIHKSQGAEYKSVIINLQCAHHIMLTRPLVYTAITRGKDRVIIVGERRALCISIKKTDTEKRGTCLAHRLQELA